nr:ketosteroid isomerase family protein [Mycolicibacterium setense]
MVFTRDELLGTVELSPQAAGTHDRQGWVGLFAAGGTVEDPVGSRPHRGAAQIERFYDTFIAPRDITFHRDADIVSGSTVIRDLELEVAMSPSVTMRIPAYLRYAVVPAPAGPRIAELQAYWELPSMIRQFASAGAGALPVGLRLAGALLRNQGPAGSLGLEVAMSPSVTMRIPAYLRYAVVPAPAGPRIAELQAYWELPSMIRQFASAGAGALPVGLRLAGALLRNQGPAGSLGFAKGMTGAGRSGKRLIAGLFDELCGGDEVAVQRRLGADAVIRSGDDEPLSTSGLVERTAGASWRKMIASGSSVVAGLDRDGHRAVLIAELGRGPRAVTRLRHFADAT